jgi:hypothetical protein
MPFIGNQPAEAYSAFQKQDFTTSATTSYTLDHPVANQNEIALFINFVRQEPTTAYTASGTSLTLTSATSSSDDMYCVYLGKAVQTVNPPAGSVGLSQLSATGTKDSTTFLRGDNTFASAGGDNTPAFFAYNSVAISLSNSTLTKARLNAEDFDTDNAFDSTTNYRFTVPNGKSGKYFINYGTEARSTNNDIFVSEAYLYKNGSQIAVADVNNNLASNAAHRSINVNRSVILDLSVGDYLEVFGYISCTSPASGFPTFEGGSTTKNTFMGGYKIIE